jgi:hypothetical protein
MPAMGRLAIAQSPPPWGMKSLSMVDLGAVTGNDHDIGAIPLAMPGRVS